MAGRGYKDLIVWQKSIELTELIYALVKGFPKEEIFGLSSQMKRAAVSIPANIAEGTGRKTQKDYKHFLSIAYGSALELETHLILSKRFMFGKIEMYKQIENTHTEVLKMLHKMHLTTED